MPIHDVGYRPWGGEKTPASTRWQTITLTGVRLALKSRWIRRVLFAAWLPVMYWGVAFFLVEKAIEQSYPQGEKSLASVLSTELGDSDDLVDELQQQADDLKGKAAKEAFERQLSRQLQMFSQTEKVLAAIESDDPEIIRRDVWRWLLMLFFRYPQSFLIVFLVGSVAPALISRDIQSRAFLLYFSKPIGRMDYILGKMMVPATFIAGVTTLPALVLFLFAVLMSPGFSVLAATWDIPLRILASTVVLVIPTASLALMLSSLTQESRFATFAWFAVWVLGHGAYFAVVIATAIRLRSEPFSPEVMASPLVEGGSALSLYNCLGNVQAVIFGMESFGNVWLSALVLLGVTAFCWIMLYRRVSSPIRI